jgi:hypothetical protein
MELKDSRPAQRTLSCKNDMLIVGKRLKREREIFDLLCSGCEGYCPLYVIKID